MQVTLAQIVMKVLGPYLQPLQTANAQVAFTPIKTYVPIALRTVGFVRLPQHALNAVQGILFQKANV